jgi:hypothetical protein
MSIISGIIGISCNSYSLFYKNQMIYLVVSKKLTTPIKGIDWHLKNNPDKTLGLIGIYNYDFKSMVRYIFLST